MLEQKQINAKDRAAGRVELFNINHPGKSRLVDEAPYRAMRSALLSVLPSAEPGFTFSDMEREISPHLPERVFPGGDKAGWWLKAVQLDLEARGEIKRAKCRPLRFSRAH
jgi:hypothetical protein